MNTETMTLTVDQALDLIAERHPEWTAVCERCRAMSEPRRTWNYRWIWQRAVAETGRGLFSRDEEEALRTLAIGRRQEVAG